MPRSGKRLSASLEDYLETIHHIVEEKQVARAKEIATRLKVSRSSVTEAFRSLSQKGLINYAPYEVITLTPAGTKVARDVIRRHQALKDFFLRVLAVEEELAEEGACQIEHTAPRPIIERLSLLMNYLDECPQGGADWIKNFNRYCQTGKTPDKCRECQNTNDNQ
ncbi:metal-dependent transcriptional regulator [Desulfurivibrio alkaliphilus]|uniref:Transcriptional regulator MntR n=1 Tax=Desulfurivibrio alkaliphilus (strain DSM 19089 / UNIQEM U267 / AHT2) TaxID=589865 RepID=D6YZQ7_DESAT|nr:metal-dependent transcriptional regulator [Desulfurivibrio alkaliphilus]ADH85064.1 iron (metal) dependent repressor, DtxR family [Desulfurivibrio alkaliphilus AHT 2]